MQLPLVLVILGLGLGLGFTAAENARGHRSRLDRHKRSNYHHKKTKTRDAHSHAHSRSRTHHRVHAQVDSLQQCTIDVATLLNSNTYMVKPGDWNGDNDICSNWQRSRGAAALLHAATSVPGLNFSLTLAPVCAALSNFNSTSCDYLDNAWNDDILWWGELEPGTMCVLNGGVCTNKDNNSPSSDKPRGIQIRRQNQAPPSTRILLSGRTVNV